MSAQPHGGSSTPSGELVILPNLTAALPGIGGRIKQSPEDFLVEEIPAYEPVGEGEHLFLWIEKRDVAAEQLAQHLARVLDVSRHDIGMAGLKDRHAVTRQYVSVPADRAERIAGVDTDRITVLHFRRHRNKLRTGHLRANRFSIIVREVDDDALAKARAIAAEVTGRGFPNYFGDQRFGVAGETLRTGLDLLAGRRQPRDLPARRRRFLQRLSLSAAQSHLFNRALAERLEEGLVGRVLAGDVMQVTASGGPFVAADVSTEQARCDRGETVVTGPLFGPKMTRPTGEPAVREARLLTACGLAEANFQRYRRLTPGTRRPYLIRPVDTAIEPESGALRFRFTLPKGVYATALLREFRKSDDL